MTKTPPEYSVGEEIANSVTHGLGLLLSIAGLVVLVVLACLRGNVWHIVSSSIYGSTLILLYTSSTLYHSIPLPRVKHVSKIIDHSTIYLLIAGTYTPFTLVTLRGSWGWTLFGLVWGLALAGIVLEAFWVYRPRAVSALVYLGMGWLVIIAVKPLLANLSAGGLWLLVAGGLSYTAGVAFYVLKKVRYMHFIWHVFVLAGSIIHFFSVMLYVLPAKS